jgi:GT2 family glycosyltransferase
LIKARLISLLSFSNFFTKLAPRVFRKRRLGLYFGGVDYFGDTSGFPFPRMKFSRREKNTLFIGEAVIRGPIVWSSEKFRHLGGFNDVAFFLGRDDCDLSLRGMQRGYTVGYLPCEQISNPNHGTTRKPRTEEVHARLEERNVLHLAHPGTLDFYWDTRLRERREILADSKPKRISIT